jgi:hypothetical protein
MTKHKETTGHGPGRGKHSISSTVSLEVLEALDYLATRSDLTRGGYVSEAVNAAVLAGTIYPRASASVQLPAETARKVRQSIAREKRERPPR